MFAALESGCPLVFGPSPLASDYGPDLIWRRYNNTDARIDVSKTKGVFVSHFRAANPLLLGTIEQVIADGGKVACEAWHKLLRT